MTDFLLSIVMNLTDYWILVLLMQYVCMAHLNLRRKTVLLGSGMCILNTFLAAALETFHILPYSSVLCMILLIFLTVLFFDRKKTDFFLFFPALAVYFVLGLIPENLLNVLIPSIRAHFLLPESHISTVAVLSDFSLLIFLLTIAFFAEKYRTIVPFGKKEIFGSIGLALFAMIDMMLLLLLDRENMTALMYDTWVFIFAGTLICAIGYYLYSLLESRIRLYRRTAAENELLYLRLQLDALGDVRENEERVKKMRHDLSNHLSVIQSLCDEGKYEEVRNYTQQLHEDIALPGGSVLTGSRTADLVVRNKQILAEKSGIRFMFSGSLDRLCHMRESDLCSLLANAYDNAIEACRSLEDAYVCTDVKNTRNYTVIRITNPVREKVSVRGGKLSTGKKDSENHGYGTEIIKEIVHKYNGSCEFSCTEREFGLRITLLS